VLQAVIFDLDGTLLDTAPDFTLALNQLLTQHGKPPVGNAAVRKFVSAGAAAIVRQGFDLAADDPRLPALLQEFLSLYSAQIPQTVATLFDDIDLLIASLLEQGLAWGIMTNKHRRFSEPLLSRFENFATSGALVCPDDVGAAKPDPAGILAVCQQLGVAPAHAVYVGDHPRDIEAAVNAGMPGLAVSWGYLPDDLPIQQWGAAAVIDTPQQLIEWCLRQ
jgi:N-acetyl-D-muramate 6-phosphate phosphatase